MDHLIERRIFHVDVNSAYLSWEAVHRMNRNGSAADLREIPSAVAGDLALRRGIILAKSIPAKAFGIRTGEAVWEARQKCPELTLVPPNYNLYETASEALLKVLKRYSPDVEQYSVDEAFVDMTGTEGLWGESVRAAKRMGEEIKRELGFTVNIGVSDNKLLAKMASDFKKPDRVHTLFSYEIEQKLWPLPVSDLFFVGRATAKKLLAMGIRTIGDLAKSDPHLMKQHLKKHGEVIWAFANGTDLSVVQTDPPPNKGYGNSTTIAFDVTDAGTAKMVLLALSETLGSRLREAGVRAELVAVGIKDWELNYSSHQMILDSATDITWELHRAACRLFDELWDGRAVRHLGIHAGRIQDKDNFRQMNIFDDVDYEKLAAMDRAVDQIRGRYGMDSVKRAVFLGGKIGHMEGGVPKEFRSKV